MRALRLIKSDQRNLKKVTDTGVGTGNKEESLVKSSRVEVYQNSLHFNIGSVRFPPQSPAPVFSYLPLKTSNLLLPLRVATFFTQWNLSVAKNCWQEFKFQIPNSIFLI